LPQEDRSEIRRNSLIRPSVRFASVAVLTALSLPFTQASAQTKVPPAPAQTPTGPAQTPTGPAQTPVAPAPAAAPVFPKPDPQYFTAPLPTKETVDAFLQANWGYEESRIWQVQAILKTPVEGISKVIVFVGDKTGKEKPSALEFFALPDGKHIITGNQIVAFGANPFADYRALVQQQANGPYRGSAAKDLELVEFADFQCPHCKEAQANMDKLATDFPKARIVFENDPIASIHPQAEKAAYYGACVAKLGGSTAFFQFASAVFDGQEGLVTPDGATMTLNSALAKAGLDPAKIAACAATPEIKAGVDASVKLAADLGIGQVPTLVINGREVPANAPYDVLKKIVTYQAKLDGVTL
jgi:protein-disulfide isomerase